MEKMKENSKDSCIKNIPFRFLLSITNQKYHTNVRLKNFGGKQKMRRKLKHLGAGLLVALRQ